MSKNDDPNHKKKVKQMQKLSLEARRERQYSILKDWDQSKMTGRQCIERIVDLEKIIYIDSHELRKKDGQVQRPENGKDSPSDK